MRYPARRWDVEAKAPTSQPDWVLDLYRIRRELALIRSEMRREGWPVEASKNTVRGPRATSR